MRGAGIRSSPRVKSGKQYRALRSAPTPPRDVIARPYLEILRESPGRHYRHGLTTRELRAFLEILPDWATLSVGLNCILLASARPGCDGYHRPGLVAICAQPRNLSQFVVGTHFVNEHRDVLDRIGVPIESTQGGHVLHFTRSTLRAYLLLHVLLHELGHHHDRMTTRSKRRSARGERFAELYARTHGDDIWGQYVRRFPDDLGPQE